MPHLFEYLPFSDDRQAARALLLAGLFDEVIFRSRVDPEDFRSSGIDPRKLFPSSAIIMFRTERINRFLRSAKSARSATLLDRLAKWAAHWDDIVPSSFRLQIDPTHDRSRLAEPEFLAGLFASKIPEISGISIAVPNRHWYLPESLPILIEGRFNGAESSPRVARLDAANTDDTELEASLLVFGPQEPTANALSTYISKSRTFRAPAAIFLQTVPEQQGITTRLLDVAMERSGLGFAASIPVDMNHTGAWLTAFSTEYRRHGQLDELLLAIHRRLMPHMDMQQRPSPVLLVGEDFLDGYLIDPRKHLKERLRDKLDHYAEYDSMAREAPGPLVSELNQLKSVGAVKEALKKRYVQVEIRENGAVVPTLLLRPSTDYTVELFLDAIIRTSITSTEPLPVDGLQFTGGTEQLRVVLNPLFMAPDQQNVLGQAGTLTLPKEGRSTSVEFSLKTPSNLRDFRVRIIVLHQSAVLQTLILGLEPLAGDPNMGLPYRLVVESELSRKNAVARPDALKFDLTLVHNDNPDGVPGVTAYVGDIAFFTQPSGWEEFVGKTQSILSNLTASATLPDQLDDPILNGIVRRIAWAGSTALDQFVKQAPKFDYSSARNLQVIEAVNGAFIPIEFFYDGPAPDVDARLCKSARQALEHRECDPACCETRSAAVICPLSFWGLSKRIERKNSSGLDKEIAITVPRSKPVARRILDVAAVGASDRVQKVDYDDLETSLKGSLKTVHCVPTWKAWAETVASHRPNLLVLLPHTAPYPDAPEQLAMEIQNSHLLFAQMKRQHVHADDAPEPVVLLLGCETAAPKEVHFMNFASKFHAHGALLVISTVSEVRGCHVAGFAGDLAKRLKQTVGDGPTDFGQVFLSMKRELFASGNALGLTLIAYGDTAWELDHDK